MEEGRSLAETPTYLVATVITVIVVMTIFFEKSLDYAGRWLESTRRGSLFAPLDKIKEELVVFGVMSLLMTHWIGILTKICIKSSPRTSHFFPCELGQVHESEKTAIFRIPSNVNDSVSKVAHMIFSHTSDCPDGKQPLVLQETLEQLHRLMFVLAFVHVAYTYASIFLALNKIYSWRVWEKQVKSIAKYEEKGTSTDPESSIKVVRYSSFVSNRTSHSWSQHRVLVWLLCFSRQFWNSLTRADYMALRTGFVRTHKLHLSYDFHNYMLRSMEEEFKKIVGISVPLWIYAISCLILDFQGSEVYFWLSFLPMTLMLLLGTKLHRVVVKLAVEIKGTCPATGELQYNLRDDLFWFGRPQLLLRLLQIISFQNAFEMAMFTWSWWEIRNSSCFMDNRNFLVIRLTFGVASQCWCSYVTFPLYLIVAQMGSSFKKSILSREVRRSLWLWQQRARHNIASTSRIQATRISSSLDLRPGNLHSISKSRRRCTSLSRLPDHSSNQFNELTQHQHKKSCDPMEELWEEDLSNRFYTPSRSSFSDEDFDHREKW